MSSFSLLPIMFGLLALALALHLPACQTPTHPAVKARNQLLAQEPRGDYFIGRRYHMPKTRWWGFLRKPGQPWDKSRAVIMNERERLNPDRLPEVSDDPNALLHGYDHNYEYKIRGYFTGRTPYDPNINLILPEFVPQDFELISKKPGFLFSPGERYHPKRAPEQAKKTR